MRAAAAAAGASAGRVRDARGAGTADDVEAQEGQVVRDSSPFKANFKDKEERRGADDGM